MSSLQELMPPHIKSDDNFYKILFHLASQPNVRNLLDIGASSGEGSTAALAEGCSYKNDYKIFAIEISKERFAKLTENYKNNLKVVPINGSSIKLSNFPSVEYITNFYNKNKTLLNNYPLEKILEWRETDLDYIKKFSIDEDSIKKIKKNYSIKNFDMVIIDGSEFTGEKELELVWGSSIICLDDVNGFKTYNAYNKLKGSDEYILLSENLNERNGYATFYKR